MRLHDAAQSVDGVPRLVPFRAEQLPHPAAPDDAAYEDAVNYILDDCFFSLGQGVGDRKTVEHTAVVWWRDHFRAAFLRTLRKSGNTWLNDRGRVTAVGHLLGRRAVRYAADRPSIDVECARLAAADVKAYCTRGAEMSRRRSVLNEDGVMTPLHAGYWCVRG
jgi:hypothetical protein